MRKFIFSTIIGIFLSLCFLSFPGYPESNDKIDIYLFSSSHCSACISLKNEFLSGIVEKHKDIVKLKDYSIDEPNNLSFLMFISQHYGRKKLFTPSLLIGDDFIVGRRGIEKNLERLIQKYSEKDEKSLAILSQKNLIEAFKSITPQKGANYILERFRKLPILAIIIGGFFDGVNPCAFAVIVFFMSFLSVYGYQRREVICIGIFYVLAVFITYVLIGLGIFEFIYRLRHFYLIMKIFYYFMASVCFIFAVFSLFDYIKFKRTGRTEGWFLQLPDFLKRKINLVIGRGLRTKSYRRTIELCAISFFVGFVVSLLEAFCTGQIYGPIIGIIVKTSELRLKAFLYLVIYNIMFILPLMVIFIVSLIGVSSQELNQFLKRNVGRIKLSMVFLFIFLGMFILLGDKLVFLIVNFFKDTLDFFIRRFFLS